MKFACPNPNCDNGVGFGDRKCSKCGFELSLGALRKHYFSRMGDGIRRRALTRCPFPSCGAIIPIASRECPNCKQPLTVNAAFAPAQARIRQMAQQRDPGVLRRVQLVYFLLSGAALIGLLCYVENQSSSDLTSNAFMSLAYLVVILVLVRLFVRPEKVRLVMRHISPLVKFTLIVNYLTLLLFLQVCVGVWWKKASILAGLFGTTFAAIIIVGHFLWPVAVEAQNWFAEPAPPAGFNPSNPQGRTFRSDDRLR